MTAMARNVAKMEWKKSARRGIAAASAYRRRASPARPAAASVTTQASVGRGPVISYSARASGSAWAVCPSLTAMVSRASP